LTADASECAGTKIATLWCTSKGAKVSIHGVGVLQLTTVAATAKQAIGTRAKATTLWDTIDAQLNVEVWWQGPLLLSGKTRASATTRPVRGWNWNYKQTQRQQLLVSWKAVANESNNPSVIGSKGANESHQTSKHGPPLLQRGARAGIATGQGKGWSWHCKQEHKQRLPHYALLTADAPKCAGTKIATLWCTSKGTGVSIHGVGVLQLTTGAATANQAIGTRAKAATLWDTIDAQLNVKVWWQGPLLLSEKTRASAATRPVRDWNWNYKQTHRQQLLVSWKAVANESNNPSAIGSKGANEPHYALLTANASKCAGTKIATLWCTSTGARVSIHGVGVLQLTTGAATANQAIGTRARAATLWDTSDAQLNVEVWWQGPLLLSGKTRASANTRPVRGWNWNYKQTHRQQLLVSWKAVANESSNPSAITSNGANATRQSKSWNHKREHKRQLHHRATLAAIATEGTGTRIATYRCTKKDARAQTVAFGWTENMNYYATLATTTSRRGTRTAVTQCQYWATLTVTAPGNKGGVGSVQLTTGAATATNAEGTRAKTAALWDATDAQIRIEVWRQDPLLLQGRAKAGTAQTATAIDDACRCAKEAWGFKFGMKILPLTTFTASASKQTNAKQPLRLTVIARTTGQLQLLLKRFRGM
jgi:CobQ-like glutamine amidotransferase family enzyme